MQRKADGPFGRKSGLGISMKDFNVDILIERARQPVTRRRENSPAATGWRGVCYGRLISGIAEPEDRECLQVPVQEDGPVS